MKSIIISFFIIFVTLSSTYGVELPTAYTIHRSNRPVTCYYDSTMKQTAIKLYPNKAEGGAGHEVKVVGHDNGCLIVWYGDFFYIKKGSIAIYNSSYQEENYLTPLFETPNRNSEIKHYLNHQYILEIIDVFQDWLKRSRDGMDRPRTPMWITKDNMQLER